jgi:hypothetical protein
MRALPRPRTTRHKWPPAALFWSAVIGACALLYAVGFIIAIGEGPAPPVDRPEVAVALHATSPAVPGAPGRRMLVLPPDKDEAHLGGTDASRSGGGALTPTSDGSTTGGAFSWHKLWGTQLEEGERSR